MYSEGDTLGLVGMGFGIWVSLVNGEPKDRRSVRTP